MNSDRLIVRIFVIDPEDNREELDLSTPLMRALLPASPSARRRNASSASWMKTRVGKWK